ncbi:hypothetical protein VTL71DRAFT_6366 [Oculimacula yallundae]|uniref:Uncharacterized protein n=1 Tax=Oculimacula yallundae TaxID=86028 RepID=A0ABR4BWS0_9HELO
MFSPSHRNNSAETAKRREPLFNRKDSSTPSISPQLKKLLPQFEIRDGREQSERRTIEAKRPLKLHDVA